MAATIILPGNVPATISDDLVWACPDPGLLSGLNDLLGHFPRRATDPNPPYHVAMAALDTLGGTLERFDDTEPPGDLVH